jgi:hypothetical protein
MPLPHPLVRSALCRRPRRVRPPGGLSCPPGRWRLAAQRGDAGHRGQSILVGARGSYAFASGVPDKNTTPGVTATEYLADCLGWSGALNRCVQRLREWAVSGSKSIATSPGVPAHGHRTLVPRSAAEPSAAATRGKGSSRPKPPSSTVATRRPPSEWKLWAWVPQPPRPPKAVVVFRKAVPPPPPRQPIKAMRMAPPRLPSLPLAATLRAAPSRPLQRPSVPARARLPARAVLARRARWPNATSMPNRTARRPTIWPSVVHLRVRLRRVKRALIAGFGARALQKA